ncbi:hypothetical protein BDN70DRAFT_847856 [Pholiota conissans]|uniref:Uncharacterized protein n=1 Tax=Pholiota conissans TaxID=109636 RepID=A0A9P6CZR5_9AGAR|nr:hypothetical protein BDN70DRAFT_847856 [Pholiota conissans]
MALTRTLSLPRQASRTQPPTLNLLPVRRYGSTGGYRLRLRSSIDTAIEASKYDLPALRVPMEMLEEIIEQYATVILAPAIGENAYPGSQKTAYKMLFAPLTLVSKDFRHLALREFFRILVFSTTEDSTGLLKFLDLLEAQYATKGRFGGYRWVRFLSAPSFLIPPNIRCLQNLNHLEELRVDFSHSGLILQRSCIGQLFSSLAASQNSVQNLTSLKLTELPRVDAQLLGYIAKGLPNLVRLHCTSTESLDLDCCANCYEDSMSRINHSPVPDIFPDVIRLANAFGSALVPLKNLTHIFFGIYLSPSDMLEMHTTHAPDDTTCSITVESVYNCAQCVIIYEKLTKQRELLTSLIVAHYLESLKTISWSSCFGVPCEEARDKNSNDAENVLQGGGDLRTDIRLFANFAWSSNVFDRLSDDAVQMPCKCEGHGFKTSFSVSRASEKIKVSRKL